MKKGFMKVGALLFALTLGTGLAGCGLKAPEVKVEKGTVRIAVLDRGYGKQFAYDLALLSWTAWGSSAYSSKLWCLYQCRRSLLRDFWGLSAAITIISDR